MCLLQPPSNRPGGAEEGGEIGPARLVERGRDGDDKEVGFRDLGRIGGQAQGGMGEIARLHLMGTIMAGLELGYASRIDVETDDRRALSGEGDRDRQADIAKPDDGELSTV